ncbi:MAG: SRPBCC family protein [Fimbriimonas sp.]
MNEAPATDREILITRTFDAPRELVFRAWTDPTHLEAWYSPRACRLQVIEMDVREGGSFRLNIRHPEFGDCPSWGVFDEIKAPERLVFMWGLADAEGRPVDSVRAGKDSDWPPVTTVTVTFAEVEGGRTRVTLHQNASEAVGRRTGAYPSWLEMLDRLAETLPTFA